MTIYSLPDYTQGSHKHLAVLFMTKDVNVCQYFIAKSLVFLSHLWANYCDIIVLFIPLIFPLLITNCPAISSSGVHYLDV